MRYYLPFGCLCRRSACRRCLYNRIQILFFHTVSGHWLASLAETPQIRFHTTFAVAGGYFANQIGSLKPLLATAVKADRCLIYPIVIGESCHGATNAIIEAHCHLLDVRRLLAVKEN